MIVDDGSGPQHAETFEQSRPYAHVISYPDNKGKGHALKTAFAYIWEQYGDLPLTIVTLDCDGQHRITDAVRACEVAEANPGAMVLGSRKQSKASPWKSRFGNGLTRFVFRLATGVHLQDTQTGLRAFGVSYLPILMRIPGSRYEYEMNVLLQLARSACKLIEVPIETIYIRNNAGTHFRAIRDSLSIYAEILKFAASSMVGFLVDYTLYSLLLLLTGHRGLLLANVLARVVSASVNFSMNYKLVFRSHELLVRSALKYAALACLILILNSGLLYLLTVIIGWSPYVSKILVELVLFLMSWLVQRNVVFSKPKGKEES